MNARSELIQGASKRYQWCVLCHTSDTQSAWRMITNHNESPAEELALPIHVQHLLVDNGQCANCIQLRKRTMPFIRPNEQSTCPWFDG